MTAINIVRQLDCTHVVSDGAGLAAQGRLAHRLPKVQIMPHLNCAVAVRGNRILSTFAHDAITASAATYDDLRTRAVPILRDYLEPIRSIWESQFGPRIFHGQIFIATYNHAFAIATSDANAAFGLRAWQPLEITGHLLTPSDDALGRDFARLQLEFNDAKAVELAERQRAIPAPLLENPNEPGPYAVGGFIQLTTIRKTGIETRILKHWPDKIGEKIQPHMEKAA
jgi:hypothetical protein